MPVKIIDYSDTDKIDNVAEMRSNEISIEEDDVDQYLTPFLYKYFDEELEANKKRYDADGFERLEDVLPEQRCYTVRDIMEILMCGKVTVYDLLKKNEFRYIRLGRGAYRISKRSFDEWLDHKKEE